MGTGKGAENGILIKSGEYLEKAHSFTALVLDKTGTITKGEPEFTDLVTLGDYQGQEQVLLELAGRAEKNSEHPLAQAIYKKALDTVGELIDSEQFKAIPGHGVQLGFGGKQCVTAQAI